MLTIGSRGSKLALWQARWVQQQLEKQGEPGRIEIIRTTGDKITDVPLAKVGTKGLFTKEIEEALLAGAVDLAVHSLKDMPTDLPPGLALAAVPEREDPRDALVGRRLEELGPGARVGTSSLRRTAQLLALRPDLRVEPLRGNLDTRLRKVETGEFDAIVLAAAGLRRMGWEERIAQTLAADVMCPAVGQGALAIETREEQGGAAAAVAGLNHPPTRSAVSAERALLRALGGGCQVPIGAFAVAEGGLLAMRAVVISPDGSLLLRREISGSEADSEQLGARLASSLLAAGGKAVLDAVYGGGR